MSSNTCFADGSPTSSGTWDSREKVRQGRALHQVREATNRAYLRKRLGVVDKKIDVSLASPRHHLRGRLDEVLFFDDGSAGPLDYKFARDPGRVYTTLRLQSAIYALLIRENFGVPVRRGYLVYTRSNHRTVAIDYQPEDFRKIGRTVREVLAVVSRGELPRRALPSRCVPPYLRLSLVAPDVLCGEHITP